MVRIIIVDNHTLYRIGLKTILSHDPRFEIIGDYGSFTVARDSMSRSAVNLVVADLSVNEECGYDVPAFIKKSYRDVKVVILSHSKEESHIRSAAEEGIDAFIHKDAEPGEILLGLTKVIAGQKYYSVEISEILVNSTYRRQNQSIPFLTTKEKEIIRLLMEGYSSKQIAGKLAVSPRTIHSHRANILGKFNLHNTTQLITRIAEQKIVI